jgi:hypothetical protein
LRAKKESSVSDYIFGDTLLLILCGGCKTVSFAYKKVNSLPWGKVSCFLLPTAVADARRVVSGIELKFLTAFLRVILAACLLLTARINFAAVPSLLMQACCFKMPAKSG